LQGPAELLPVSSSGHLALLPSLLGWPYVGLRAPERKAFEVVLHAASAGAQALAFRRELARLGRRDAALLGLTLAPVALAGFVLERPVERRLGGVRGVALAQVAGGLALALADRAPERRADPGAADHLAVGLAQVAALAPGVSRAGAALTVARLRGLDRPAAARLSRRAALPVTLGAGGLKALRLAREGFTAELRAPFAAGAAAAFVATFAARGLAARLERVSTYAPLAAYRVGLGLAALARAPKLAV
jgi:undecaprenyl-diphosphatase